MKALLLIPTRYSIAKSIEGALKVVGADCTYLDYRSVIASPVRRINTQMFRFPDNIRMKWEYFYLGKINRWYLTEFDRHKPDLVFIYNNEMLLPETLDLVRKKGIKIAFYLGDNPLYTTTSRYNLAVLQYADAVFVPDSFWLMQLRKLGLNKVEILLPSLPSHSYFPLPGINPNVAEELKTEILYAGMNYNDSWGYKKAQFMSCFTGYDLKIYGNKAWKRWFLFFPELEKHFYERNTLIPLEQLNRMYNCTKIIPADGNPGILNGIHLRVIEALAAGTLPLMEWTPDVDVIFKGIRELPAVKDYGKIRGVVDHYLKDEQSRVEMVREMAVSYANINNDKNNSELISESVGINV